MKKTFTEWLRHGNVETLNINELRSKVDKCVESVNEWAEWYAFKLKKDLEVLRKIKR